MCKCSCCDCCCKSNKNEACSLKELIAKAYCDKDKTFVLKNTCGDEAVEAYYSSGEIIIRDKSDSIDISNYDLNGHMITSVCRYNGWIYYYLS